MDLVAMFGLLVFVFTMRETQPGLAGVVVGAAIQFWLTKNAATPHPTDPGVVERADAAAKLAADAAHAAAELLQTAAITTRSTKS